MVKRVSVAAFATIALLALLMAPAPASARTHWSVSIGTPGYYSYTTPYYTYPYVYYGYPYYSYYMPAHRYYYSYPYSYHRRWHRHYRR
jgi:hypothetical protein